MKLLELQTKTYMGKEYRDYIQALMRENDDDLEQWQKDMNESEIIPPKEYRSRVFINPDLIMTYVETFSLEQMHNNPKNPKFDTIDICMSDGLNLTVVDTIENFQAKLEQYYADRRAEAEQYMRNSLSASETATGK